MEEEEPCNISLDLGLGSQSFASSRRPEPRRKARVQFDVLFPPRMKDKSNEEETRKEEDDLEGSSLENKDEEKEIAAEDKNDSYNNNGFAQKKLRLTKEQSVLLEDSFGQHRTLNSIQKSDLAKRLNLSPRQVEVWFQNKRARTKLKQMEVDYESLTKFCDDLRDENRKLKRELQELRSAKPLYIQLPKARAPEH